MHRAHHDLEHGRTPRDDAAFLERLALEIMQPGLSWLLVLQKRDALRRAFSGFDLDRAAAFDDADLDRLCADATIIRHRKKLAAVVVAARAMRRWRAANGSVYRYLAASKVNSLREWREMLRPDLAFFGPSVAQEFICGVGLAPGAHRPDCPIAAEVLSSGPLFLIR